MPAPQTSYTENIQPGVEGQIASMWGGADATETGIVETAAGIGFGRAVSQGAVNRGIVLGGTIANFKGITIRDVSLVPLASQTVDVYPQRYNAGVLNQGDIWVRPVAAVALGAVASFDGTTGQLNPVAAGITIPGSRYMRAASAGQLTILRLTRPNP